MKTVFNLFLAFAVAGLALSVSAQDEVPPPMPDDQSTPTFSTAQLDQLTGPVALYPDPLIAVLLPAATQPSQIVLADRYIQNGGDPNAVDQQPWDPNVQALAHYPDVLAWMDNNLNWTTQLGEAFAGQQQDVMDSVQRLRLQAYNLGNLVSTPQQQVVNDGGNIEIIPTSPNNIYVPDYQPSQVYYQQPYGAPFITFSVGFVIGPWLCGDFDWHNHHLVVWNHSNPRPRNWWHDSPQQRTRVLSNQRLTWQPQNHAAFQPQGDRGWNNQSSAGWVAPGANNRNRVPPANNHTDHTVTPPRNNNTPNAPHWTAPPVTRPTPAPAPAPTQHFNQNTQRQQNDTLIGIQNANDARNYSNRGQQSMQTTTHNEAPAHSNTGGGTGGSSTVHSSGGASSGSAHSTGGGGGGSNQRH